MQQWKSSCTDEQSSVLLLKKINTYCSVFNSVFADSHWTNSFWGDIIDTDQISVCFTFVVLSLPCGKHIPLPKCFLLVAGIIFQYPQYLLAVSNMMKSTWALTLSILFQLGCMYANMHDFYVWFHIIAYYYVSSIIPLYFICFSALFNISFQIISDWLSVNSKNFLFLLLDH